MKGARGRAGAGVGNGPRGLLSEDKLSHKNFYEDIYQIFNQTRTKDKFTQSYKSCYQSPQWDTFYEDIYQIFNQTRTKDKFTQSYKSRYQSPQWDTDEETNFIHTLFDDLNTPDLISHAKRIFDDNNSEPRFSSLTKNQEIYRIPAPPYMNKDPEIVFTHLKWFRFFFPKDLTNEEKEEERKKINEISKQEHRKSLMIHRAKKEREEPKNLPEVLKKINSRCDPSEEKIKKVIEEYKKYKEPDSGEEDLQKKQDSKIALIKAIDDALKTCIPHQMQMSDEGIDYLHRKIVNEPFDTHKTDCEKALSQKNYELLQRLKEGATTKVSDYEFNGIVGFLDRMPKAELNALLVVHQSSIQMQASGALMDESEPLPQSIPAEDAKRDKVAEFKKFLKKIDPNSQITQDKYDEILLKYDDYRISEENFKTRKTGVSNLILIDALKRSETTLKDSISSCLQLSTVAVPTSSIQANEAKKESNETISYQIKDNEFYEVLKYLEYEQIKAHYEQNPPPKIKYDPPPNDTLDELFKSIRDLPSNIFKTFGCIRVDDSSNKESGPPNAGK